MQVPENKHVFLAWCADKEVSIAFVGEVWIEKNRRGTQTYPRITLMLVVKKGRNVML